MSCSRSDKAEELAVALGRPGAGGERVERRGHRARRRRRGRASLPSAKKHRHCGSSADEVEVVVEVAAGLGEDAAQHRRAWSGWSAPCRSGSRPRSSTAALPPSQAFFSKSDDLVAARRQRAGRRQAAEPAADHADAIRFAARGLIAASHTEELRRCRAITVASSSRSCGAPPRGHALAACAGSPSQSVVGRPRSCSSSRRRDPGRLVDHRQAAAGVRAAADEVDAVQVLEAVARPQVEHLPEVVGQVERRPPVDRRSRPPSRPA